jgi:hypothetical protein
LAANPDTMVEASEELQLPDVADAGTSATWTLPTQDGNREVTATFLGLGTSRMGDHRGHAPGTVQRRRPRDVDRRDWSNCGACRWSELRIFKGEDEDVYYVHTVGRSLAEGEKTLSWLAWAANPQDLYRTLQERPGGQVRSARMSVPAMQALEMAAGYDQRLYRQLVQRGASA